MKDYYLILEVSPQASQDEIQSSYRRLAMIFHPDMAGNDRQKEYFEEKFKDINAAYRVLSDPAERAQYDAKHQHKGDVLEVSPSVIDFGTLIPGEGAVRSFLLDYAGDPGQLELNIPPSNSWMDLGNIVSVNPPDTFPIQVEVKVNSEGLAAGQKYSDVLEIRLGKNIKKVAVAFNIQSNPTAPAVPRTFRFRSGDIAQSPKELVPLCDRYWDEAKSYLYDDKQFVQWFIDLRRNDLVAMAEQSRKAPDRDTGLEQFLKALNPSLVGPKISIETEDRIISKYDYASSVDKNPKIIIKNEGRGCCYGTIEINSTGGWLTIRSETFSVPPGGSQSIDLTIENHKLIWEDQYSAKVLVHTNSQNIENKSITFAMSTPRNPKLDEIEALRDEGKWRLALEKLEELRKYANK